MQHLGQSLKGLASVLAFLGISSTVGGKVKWKVIQNIVGSASEKVSQQVMTENIKKEIQLTEEYNNFKNWTF
jgi:hypothetical protein